MYRPSIFRLILEIQEFVVQFGGEGHVGDIVAELLLDGRKAGQKLRPSAFDNNAQKFLGAKINDGSSIRPFVFAAVQTTSPDQDPLFEQDLSQLGTIEVKLYRIKITSGLIPCKRREYPSLSEIQSVPETAKITGLSCTKLAAPKTRRSTHKRYHYDEIDSQDEPYVLFRFHHLPRDVLQARGILPADRKTSSANKKGKKRVDPPVEDAGGDTKRKRTAETSSHVRVPTQLKVEEGVGRDKNSGQTAVSCDPDQVQILEQALKASQDALEQLQTQIQNLKSAQPGPSFANTSRPAQRRDHRSY